MRFGDLSLRKGKNLEIVSKKGASDSGKFSVYSTYIDTGVSLPSVIIALVDPVASAPEEILKNLPIKSLHVRSYRNWKDMVAAGFSEIPDELQQPFSIDNAKIENFKMQAIRELDAKTNRTYKFDKPEFGTITLFSNKATLPQASNGLPDSTRLLGWINDYNFVFTTA